MDISTRNQHFKALQREILHGKVQKKEVLCSGGILKKHSSDRKYLIRKINSSLPSLPKQRRREEIYDGYVRVALAKVWEIFNCPCGQSWHLC